MWNRKKNKQEAEHAKVGRMGEETACRFLMKHGFDVVERNYWKKWGEVDIIAKKGGLWWFVEVKTVSRETSGYRPEENVHPKKLERLSRTIETYIAEKDIESEWKFAVVAVYLNLKSREARCELIEDVL